MPIIKACQKEAASATNATQKRQLQRMVADICSIFGSCCIGCTDAPTVLGNYKKTLLRLMNEEGYREAGIELAKGFALLIKRSESCLKMEEEATAEAKNEDEELLREGGDEDNDEVDEDCDAPFLTLLTEARAPAFSQTLAEENLKTMKGMAEVLLQALAKLYLQCHGSYSEEVPKATGIGKGGEIALVLTLRSVMTIVCGVADSAVVSAFFHQIAGKLEAVMKQKMEDEEGRAAMLDRVVLAGELATVLPALPDAEVMEALAIIQPSLDDASVTCLQRRFYYCLVLLCRYHGAVLAQEAQLEPLTTSLLSDVLTVSALVRKYRMKCLYHLCDALSPHKQEDIALVVSSLPKFVLCIKDPSKKVRSICFDCMIRLSQVMDQSDVSITLPTGEETPCSLLEFFKILIGCMGASSPHMKSASLMCLSYVVYHHRNNRAIWPLVCSHMHVIYGVLDDKNRELIKSCFGFIRTCVKVMPQELLKEELHDVVLTMIPWANDSKNRFKLRVRAIIELVVRRMGKQNVLNEVPENERENVEKILKSEKVEDVKEGAKEVEEKMEVEEKELKKEEKVKKEVKEVKEKEVKEKKEEKEKVKKETKKETETKEKKDSKVKETKEKKKEQSYEDLVREMEEEGEKMEVENEDDDKDVMEMDDKGMEKLDLSALIQEIANSEDMKRVLQRRKEMEEGMSEESEETPEKEEEKPSEKEKEDKKKEKTDRKEKLEKDAKPKKEGKAKKEKTEEKKKDAKSKKEKKPTKAGK